ncbi:Gustatory receptor 45 [Halyomorpha halys]|nr:Gustatory receptor 45 [Halyomorpha halys]
MSQPISKSIGSNLIFTASSILGMFPFRIIDDELKMDHLLFLYSVVVTSLITIAYFLVCLKSFVFWGSIFIHQYFNNFVSICFYSTHLLAFLSLLVSIYRYRNELIEVVQTFNSLRSKFREMELKINKTPNRKFILLEILILLVCCIVFQLGHMTVGNILIESFYTLILIGMALSCGQFTFFVNTISDFFESSSNFLISIKNPIRIKDFIFVEKLVDAVSQLAKTSSKINDIYSQQCLITAVASYIAIVNHIYYIYRNASANIESRYFHIPGDFLMLLYRFYVIWRVSHTAAVACYKSKEFNILLYQLMIEDRTNVFLRSDKLKLHISMKREVVFTACGFFNLDYTLLYSMISSATTYLMILIQFGELVY